MVRKSTYLALMLATSLAGSASAALASNRSATRPAPKAPVVFMLNPQLSGQMAALFFVGERVFDALGIVRGVGVGKLPSHGTVYQLQGVQDGPDGSDPIGAKQSGPLRTDGPTPAPANNRLP